MATRESSHSLRIFFICFSSTVKHRCPRQVSGAGTVKDKSYSYDFGMSCLDLVGGFQICPVYQRLDECTLELLLKGLGSSPSSHFCSSSLVHLWSPTVGKSAVVGLALFTFRLSVLAFPGESPWHSSKAFLNFHLRVLLSGTHYTRVIELPLLEKYSAI